MKIDCVADVKCILGEGPVWDEQSGSLHWVDIKAPAIWRLDASTGRHDSWAMPSRIGAITLRTQGGYVAATKHGFAFIDMPPTDVHIITHPEAHLPDNRFNDGACDARGRFWAGTMDDTEQAPSGHLYCLRPDLSVKKFEAGFVITNAIRWNGTGDRLYFTDTAARTIWCYDFDLETGTPGERRVFAKLSPEDGWPDGLSVDADDHIWGAHWGTGRITRYTPSGQIDRTLNIPAPHVTCCTFGGETLDTLYVTTARIGMSDQQLEEHPKAGGVFAITGLGVKGRSAVRFAA